MSTDTDQHADRQTIQWGAVAFISAVGLIGVLTPKFLMMSAGYREFIYSLPIDMQFAIHPAFRMVLLLAAWTVIQSRNRSPKLTMGICVGWGRALKALALGALCTLPMLGLGMFSELNDINRYKVMYGAFAPGITEELFYRALLFGLLIQVAKTPFWTTAIVTGLFFGFAHIDITPDEGQTIIGQFNFWNLLIALGGFMYAWLYFESRWNLWLVIALHIGMNLWWGMFDLASSPLGGAGATLSRILTVGLAVATVVGWRLLEPKRNATISHE